MPSHDSFDNKNEKQEIPHCRNSFQIPIAKLQKEEKSIPIAHKYKIAHYLDWYRHFKKK